MSAIRAIQTGLSQLGIRGDDKRDLYVRLTGEDSLTKMRPAQHDVVLGYLRERGFKAVSKSGRKRLEGKFVSKLQALWIAGYNLGVIRDRSDEALVNFVKGRTSVKGEAGVDHARFLYQKQDVDRVVEAIKAMLARDGGVDWSPVPKTMPAYLRTDGYRIVCAQLRKLKAAGQTDFDISISAWFAANAARLPTLPRTVSAFEQRDWIRLMNHLGELVRRLK